MWNKIWPVIVGVVLSGMIGWGAWATVSITTKTPRPVFDEHCKASDQRFERMQNRIEDKLDKIQDRLGEHHGEDN